MSIGADHYCFFSCFDLACLLRTFFLAYFSFKILLGKVDLEYCGLFRFFVARTRVNVI